MARIVHRRAALGAAVLSAVLLATSLTGSAAAAPRTLDPNTRFFNPVIADAPLKQINALIAAGVDATMPSCCARWKSSRTPSG